LLYKNYTTSFRAESQNTSELVLFLAISHLEKIFPKRNGQDLLHLPVESKARLFHNASGPTGDTSVVIFFSGAGTPAQ
jgi:hypothetical protein